MTRGGKAAKSAGRASVTIRRGKSTKARAPVRRTKQGPTLIRRALDAQPFAPQTVRRAAVSLFTAIMLFAGYQLSIVTGVNAYVTERAINAVGQAGFAVKRIEVVGARRIDRLHVYDIALAQQDRSMAAFSLSEVRRDLLNYGWVADARVSRRLPDTLVIDLVERTPVAVWQDRGQYTLIDDNGTQLPGVDPASMPDLPIIVGRRANQRMGQLQTLLAVAPALRPQLAGATWVGNRRWDLRFKTGEVLALPDDAAQAETALANFARMDGVNRLLGRGIVRFDVRIADRFVLRPGRDGDLGDLQGMTAQDANGVRITTEPASVITGG